jgi:hypothetical protein
VKLSVRAWAITWGLFFGGTVAVVGLINMFVSGYGQPVLDLFASLYPGYSASGSLSDWVLGIVLAVVDGLIGGAIFAWLHNAVSRR